MRPSLAGRIDKEPCRLQKMQTLVASLRSTPQAAPSTRPSQIFIDGECMGSQPPNRCGCARGPATHGQGLSTKPARKAQRRHRRRERARPESALASGPDRRHTRVRRLLLLGELGGDRLAQGQRPPDFRRDAQEQVHVDAQQPLRRQVRQCLRDPRAPVAALGHVLRVAPRRFINASHARAMRSVFQPMSCGLLENP